MVIAVALMLFARAHAYDDGDFQVWNTDAEEFKINNDSRITLEEEFRWGGNAGEFYYQHYDIGLFYNLEKWLNIGGGYRHIYELKNRRFKLENEPYITLTFLWGLKGFKFEDRSRIEYRYFDYQADSGRYRNKFTLKSPWKFTAIELQPYLADEIFLDFQNKAFSRNRFYSGLDMRLTKSLKAEIYYLLQTTRSANKWADVNALGAKVKLFF